MKALYRKYRPLKLADVVGQDKTIKQLQGAISQNKISHAYLFIGPRGCGKTSVARIFAHEINQFEYQLEDSYVDIIEIDAATFTGVDNIRELREKAMIVPTTGKYKVYIIDEVHMLSTSAFNALLKILEEPPAHVVFIMATTNPEKIPATITSRTQIYRFNLAEPAVMQKFLRDISDQEGINISNPALQIISERGGGSFRDSLSILDQLSTISEPIKEIDETTVSEKEAVTGLSKEGENLPSLVNRNTVVGENEFICEYSEIHLPALLKSGDYADVRLSLADGRNYTVVSEKKIMDFNNSEEKSLVYLALCEEEIIILESALADLKLFEGSKLYLVIGKQETKNKVNYPVNKNADKLLHARKSVNNLSGFDYEVKFDKELEKERLAIRKNTGLRGQEWKEAAAYWNEKE